MTGKVIVLGVTGSIAAYKAAELTRLLVKAGAITHVTMTRAATQFITPVTMQTLSGNPVVMDMFAPPVRWDVAHVELAQAASAVVIAPASANAIARIAHGLADDFLTTTVLAAVGRGKPLFVAPAMNHSMLVNPITEENLARLERIGAHIITGDEGELACGERGSGRMAEPEEILDRVKSVLCPVSVWRDKRVIVTAGPTREHIDDVRFLSNPSSGKMGFSVAQALAERGAVVTLVCGPVTIAPPAGVEVVRVISTAEMADAVRSRASAVDAVFMAAAVADFTPRQRRVGKAAKSAVIGDGVLELEPTLDILSSLAADRGRRKLPLLIGFAAMAGDAASARGKLEAKGVDMIAANDVSAPGCGFDVDTNQMLLLFPDGTDQQIPLMSKRDVAVIIVERAADML